jgi:hypothetical protein
MHLWCGQGQLYFIYLLLLLLLLLFFFFFFFLRGQHDARSFVIFTHQILLGLSNQEDEMGTTCGWYERGERCIQGFGGETWGKEAQMG